MNHDLKNGTALDKMPALELGEPNPEVPAPETMEGIAIETALAPNNAGVLIRLTNTKPDEQGNLAYLVGLMGVEQARQLAASMLMMCDAIATAQGMPQRTAFVVTGAPMWIQGQQLIIHDAGEGQFHMRWAIPPERVSQVRSKLILPASFRPK